MGNEFKWRIEDEVVNLSNWEDGGTLNSGGKAGNRIGFGDGEACKVSCLSHVEFEMSIEHLIQDVQ